MKKNILLFAILALLFACTPEKNNSNDTEGGIDNVVHVTGISLDRPSAAIKEGENIVLVAMVSPSTANNKVVTWTSSSDAVATVDASGKVTGLKAGSATITATAEDGGMKATCALSVEANLAPSVTVDANHISAISAVLVGKANLGSTVAADLQVGFQYSTSAGILPSNSTSVEAVDADENYNYTAAITGLEPNTKYYFRSYVRQNSQYTYGETKSFTTKEISSLIHTQEASAISAVSAIINADLDLTDVVCSSKSFGFYWGTSAELLRSKVTGTEENGAISTELSVLNPSKQYYFQVFAYLDGREIREDIKSFTTKDITSILETMDASGIEATSATLNAKLDLTDVKYRSIEYGFRWGTSESSQANSLKGGDLADNAFTAIMTNLPHKTQYWYKAYVKLDSQTIIGKVKTFTTDVVPVDNVSLDKTEYIFNTVGNTFTLKATVLPTDATDKGIEWASDNAEVATVDQLGKVTAVGNGTATITVTTKDQGKMATCEITVAQWVIGISLDETSLTLNEGQERTLIPTATPSNASDKSLNWTSSNESVAIVDNNGKVTAISKGAATIKAEAKDGSGQYSTCSVTVKRPVSSIRLNRASISIYNGESETLTTTVIPSDASNTAVVWSSTNPSVVTVSGSGVITGKSKGTATITVTANDGNGAQATCEVEVKQYVTGISLDKTTLTLNEGQDQTLIPTATPSNASDKSLNWTSSNESVATVDQTGKVRAISKGTATIKATANDGSGEFATCSVTVKRPVSSIRLNKTSISIYNGESETLTASVSPSDASNTAVTWTSSNTSVAEVSGSGVVTGKSKGTATITVTANDGNGAQTTCKVEVKQYVTGISLDKTTLSLNEGQEQTLIPTATPSNASDKSLNWTSSNESVATVDQTGKVRAISKGVVTIKAEAKDGSGKYATCSLTVIRIVSSIQLNSTSLVLYRKDKDVTKTLTATVIPSDASNTAVTWSSTNPSVATVSSSGVVTSKSKGTTTIKVAANDGNGAQATCRVEVKQYVTGISLDKSSFSLGIGMEATLSVTILPGNANDRSFTWSSSDSSVASVDNDGKVTAKSKGTATIKVTANDGSGIFATCTVVVFDVPKAVDMGIVVNGKNIKWASFNLGASSIEEYGFYYAWGEIEPKSDYSWSTYALCKGSSSSLTKYNNNSSYGTVDNKTVLEPEDDAAHVKLGGKWRMPTDAEWTALRNKCTWTWTKQNGVGGYKVTGLTGNSIFLPEAGSWDRTRFSGAGSSGDYWSSSLYTGDMGTSGEAWFVYFLASNGGRNHSSRYKGFSVRPVCE